MGFILQNSGFSNDLFIAAQAYLALGYSVIPLCGDAEPDRAKIAAIHWGIYQQTRPSENQIHNWFIESGFGALGIVTGRISNLVVLDFDDPNLFQDFSSQYPHLSKHQVVQTRRGYHIYYQLPPHLSLHSRKGQGIDLLSDGRYVVARPSTINGHTYKLIRGGQPKLLTAFDIEQITRFLGIRAISTPIPSPQREFTPSWQDSGGINKAYSQPLTPVITARELLWSYRYTAQQGSRNDALFKMSLKARDAGWSQEETLKCLLKSHIQQQPIHRQAPENLQQRAQEAVRSIRSAFSRPARPQRPTFAPTNNQLPNSVREALLKQWRTDVMRTLEGLSLKGVQPGQVMDTETALTLLKGIVGRDSIYHALSALTPNGQPIFEQISPSVHPVAPDGAATATDQKQNKKMHFVRVEIPGINPKGRKKRLFVMPDNLELCQKLGVKLTSSDPITLDDLATAKQTRMALHRELIKRRPGMYSRRWLARRLGVYEETLDTYNREIPIQSRHLYTEIPISWRNLNHVPDDVLIDGAFLEDETGKRYPPRRCIAAIQLSRGHCITYKRQDANYYWYGDAPPNMSVLLGFHPQQQEIDSHIAAIQTYTACAVQGRAIQPHPSNPAPHSCTYMSHDLIPSHNYTVQVFSPLSSAKRKSQTPHYRRPLKDGKMETAAQQLCTHINSLAIDAKGKISQATVRRLVDTYGIEQVGQGLKMIAKRHPVINPTGFLMIWLQSESKKL